jgi:hypothetical protein
MARKEQQKNGPGSNFCGLLSDRKLLLPLVSEPLLLRPAALARLASRKVRRRARPWPTFRPDAETRSHRLALDVPDGGEQMLLIHHEGVETLLPEMPSPALPKIDHVSVSAMGLPQRSPQAQRVRGDHDEVSMVGH